MFKHTGGVVKELPVPNTVPPFGRAYQLYVPPAPVAVNVAEAPNNTVALAGDALGAAGEGFTTIVWVPVVVAPFLTIEIKPVVPFPAKPSI